jgi:hypothetical protein
VYVRVCVGCVDVVYCTCVCSAWCAVSVCLCDLTSMYVVCTVRVCGVCGAWYEVCVL